jgi:hypothetical protein
MSAKNGFKALRGFFAGVTEAQESRLWVTLDELTDERNLIAHGVWMTDATGAVAVVWHSRFLESENFVGAELFPAVRFEQFSQIATHSLSLFAQIRSMYE